MASTIDLLHISNSKSFHISTFKATPPGAHQKAKEHITPRNENSHKKNEQQLG